MDHQPTVRLLLISLLLAGCNAGEPVAPPAHLTPAEQLEFVATPGLTDTIGSRPPQPLVVRVRNTDGSARRHTVVRFVTLPPLAPTRPGETGVSVAPGGSNDFSALAVDSTNEAGEARALMRFGLLAGTARIVALAPEIGLADTLSVNVLPGTPTAFRLTVRDTNVVTGAIYDIGTSVLDRAGNTVNNEPMAFTATASNIRVDNNGAIVALGPGAATVAISSRGIVDTARVTVLPVTGRIVGFALPSIVLVNIDGTNAQRIATTYQTSTFPHASPGGQMVAFYEGNPYAGNATISVLTPGGTPHSIIGVGGAAWPRWSDSGEWLYYTAIEGGRRVVARVRGDGTGQRTIASFTAGEYAPPGVSADGATVAIQDGGVIAFIDVATGAVQRTGVTCNFPQFSPNGQQVACMFGSRIKIFNRNGSGERFVGAAVYNELSGVDWSPDGAYLLVVKGSSVPGTGTPVPTLVNIITEAAIPLRLPIALTQAAFVR